MAVITVTAIGVFSSLPVFWYLPSIFLAGPAAAAGIALVNTIGATAGFAAPYATGWLLDLTGSSRAGLWVVGVIMLLTAMLLLAMRQRFIATEADRVAVAAQGR
jgi:nitrate/nitrite transporter NarK